MAALIEIIIEGVKKVSSEIVAAILLLIAFAIFPSLKKTIQEKERSTEARRFRRGHSETARDSPAGRTTARQTQRNPKAS